MFQGVVLKICMPPNYFKDLRSLKEVKPNDAINWVKKCIVGNIRKHELDNERMRETNSLDMMQNSSIIYHTESILEMQMCTLISMIFLTDVWSERHKGHAENPNKDTAMMLMYVLVGEHIFSYCSGIFRKHDLKHNGMKNKQGIESASRERNLRYIEIFVDVVISIWILIALLS